MNDIENVIFDIAEALRAPVLILALLALAVTLIELGAFFVELVRRRRRDYPKLETASIEARAALERGDQDAAKAALRPVAWSTSMARSLAFIIDQWGHRGSGDRLAKGLADFDFRSLKRLERTRLLVRAGPALGLMGTLIPLSPALEGLANGNTEELSDNLRVAFSVTVLGLLIGAVAFAISLVRDRLYGQDLSDLEFVAATIAPESGLSSAEGLPAGGARPLTPLPPPPAAAAAGNKPPPPTGAKPLGTDLPPPGGAPGKPAAAPAGAGASGGPAAPPIPGAGASSGPAAPPAPGAPSSGPGGSAPPAAAPSAPVPPPPPPPPGAGAQPQQSEQAAPQAPPMPGPPIPEPPTQQLPPKPPGERPTEAQNHPPGDGHNAPTPAQENK